MRRRLYLLSCVFIALMLALMGCGQSVEESEATDESETE